MIPDAFFSIILDAVNAMLRLLPVWSPLSFVGVTITSGGGPAQNSVFQFVAWANYYVPVLEAVDLLALMATLAAALYTAKMVLWALNKLHITGGSD